MSIDTTDMDRLAGDLAAAPARVGTLVSRALRKSAADIERDAKAFAPVDTGALRNSIGTDLAGDARSTSMTADIGPTVNYAVYQEYGTSRMGPHAFMGPAFDRHAGGFVEAVADVADVIDGP